MNSRYSHLGRFFHSRSAPIESTVAIVIRVGSFCAALAAVLAVGLASTSRAVAQTAPAAAAKIDFAHDIVPVLREHCGQCHTGDQKQGGYSMNSRASLLAGGESGKAVIVGKSGDSSLIKRLTSKNPDERMPPEGAPVPDAKIALLKAWIDSGAAWQDGFTFKKAGYDPPLKHRRPDLPPAVDGRDNPIDRLLDRYLADRKLPRPEPIDDAMLARRLFLDVNGLLPTPEQLSAFVNDQRADKRSRLVSQLLADDTAYAEHWLTFWNDLLRNDYTGTGFITGGRKQITRWLYQSLTTNKPYDQMVRELIAPSSESEGFIQGIRWRGDVSASQTNEVQFAQSICQSLLGINMKCASCHDSFIDRWKLSEAYGLAAIYSSKPLMIHRCDKPTGKTAEASWIFPELGNVDPKAPQAERLKQLAALMTHPDNGRLTRTIVNRLWHRLMGRGIVHPTDAMHTEPWDADLLDFLAIDLVDHKYDLKRTISLICNSRHYQSHVAVLKNSSDDKDYVYTGPVAKRMTAEQFVDTVWQLTGSAPTRYDAPVQRGRPTAQDAAAGPLAAKWIWSYATASAASPARETFVVRKRFELPAAPSRAGAVVTCDNSYELFVNGQKVAADDNWETVEAVPLVAQLKAGQNEILIVGKNGGEGPNPAGLVFECRIWTAKSEQAIVVASDETWEWTAAKPDGRGRFAKQPADWKPAVPLANPGVWAARVTPDLIANLSNAERSGSMMVRASLVKSDALMRSLGRPNRDQIVTMRPSEMTTLEAIDLANAQTLADAIARGAGKWRAVLEAGADAQAPKTEPTKAPSTKAESSRAASTPAMIRQLYLSALSRAPSDEELAIATEILTSAANGSAPGAPAASSAAAAAIEDLLWSVVMLPEFHLIR